MSKRSKPIKDSYGDKIQIGMLGGRVNRVIVESWLTREDGPVVYLSFTPQKARKIARQLNRYASQAEIARGAKKFSSEPRAE